MKLDGARIAVGLVLFAGCNSGSATGGGAGQGSTGMGQSSAGSGFVVKDTVALRNTIDGVSDQLTIHLVSLPGLCKLYQTAAPTPSSDYDIIIIEFDSSGTVSAGMKTIVEAGDGGTYTETQGTAFYTGNRKCNTRYGGYAHGSVNLTTLDDKHAVGTYELTFNKGWAYGNGSLVKGSFDAPLCDLAPNQLPNITCM